ncbi:hypothetical protein SAMN02799630_02804 [Paenibacillus sp. UNCCL117]|nr:hypothetical protein SAMN04488602_107108 [Paenibacillus sp. cl123]SFW40659.1 hypothetical protein SAMN02799630_02804 [Paenibacillus sp. UNCCL117]
MPLSNTLATALLNQVFRNTAYTRPTTIYVALYTSNPTGADTGTEVTGGGYVRQAITFSAPTNDSYNEYNNKTGQLGTVTKPTSKNSAEIVFPIATADWGTITHIGLRDAATGGTLLSYDQINNPRTVLANDRLRLPIDAIIQTMR